MIEKKACKVGFSFWQCETFFSFSFLLFSVKLKKKQKLSLVVSQIIGADDVCGMLFPHASAGLVTRSWTPRRSGGGAWAAARAGAAWSGAASARAGAPPRSPAVPGARRSLTLGGTEYDHIWNIYTFSQFHLLICAFGSL